MKSTNYELISIEGISLYPNRRGSDYLRLNESVWEGMKQGKDGLPGKVKEFFYLITSNDGKFSADGNFKATNIEFFGVDDRPLKDEVISPLTIKL